MSGTKVRKEGRAGGGGLKRWCVGKKGRSPQSGNLRIRGEKKMGVSNGMLHKVRMKFGNFRGDVWNVEKRPPGLLLKPEAFF